MEEPRDQSGSWIEQMKIIKKNSEAFFLGILISFIALVFESFILIVFGKEISIDIDPSSLLLLALLAIIEESAKFLAIWKMSDEWQNRRGALIGATLIGVGFSLGELAYKSLAFQEIVFWENAWASLFHILTAGAMGILLAKRSGTSPLYRSILLFAFSTLHFLFNFLIIAVSTSQLAK